MISLFFTLLLFGFQLGFVLGHVDILTRVAHLNVEWFEFYQAILLPAVFWSLLTPVIGLPLFAFARLFGVRPASEELRFGLRLFLILAPLTLVIWLLVQIFWLGALKNLQGAPEGTGSMIFLVTLLLSSVLVPLLRFTLRKYASIFDSKAIRSVFSNYSFFICFFCGLLFAYDLYQYFLVERVAVKKEISSEEHPNIMLLVLDTMRADHLGLYGYDKPTSPFLDELAKESVVFEHATAVSSWTLPTHSSMFTGLNPFRHGAHRRHQKLGDQFVTLAEILRDEGYATAGFIGGPYCKAKYGIGQGFATYRDRLDFFEYRHIEGWASLFRFISFVSNEFRDFLLQTDGERLATDSIPDMQRWLKKNGDRPFFMFTNFFDVHDPYILGEEYRSLFTNETRDWEPINNEIQMFWTDPELRFKSLSIPDDGLAYLKAIYDMEIRWLDQRLRELFDWLESEGYLKNTIVIITSDHGEEFFEHGGVLHGNTLYDEVIRSPLIVHAPERFSPKRVSEQVGTIDLFDTSLDLAGFSAPEGSGIDSVSLLPLLNGQAENFERGPVLSQRYPQVPERENKQAAFSAHPNKLILVDKEFERTPNAFFDLESDPKEQQNLISEDGAVLQEMRSELEPILENKFEVEPQ